MRPKVGFSPLHSVLTFVTARKRRDATLFHARADAEREFLRMAICTDATGFDVRTYPTRGRAEEAMLAWKETGIRLDEVATLPGIPCAPK